ncbi:MAG: tetratricopeptide repeat protein [Deltaproteobacteria bacterium]|nr:tetratricopeptide repeat protein [Deltaproteobacteria bacterium]
MPVLPKIKGFLTIRKHELTAFAILVLAAGFTYYNSMNSPFVFDDIHYIERNPLIRDMARPWQVVSFNPARALLLFTFALNWRVSGNSTWSYHFVNVAIHTINSFMVYILIAWLLRHRSDYEKKLGQYVELAPLLGAMVFLLHPVQTEAVTYIVGRSSSLATSFYLLGMLIFLKKAPESEISENKKRKWPWILVLCLVYILGLAAKEIVATLPAALLLLDLLFLQRKGFKNRALKWHIPQWLVLWILVVLRLTLLGGIGNPEKGGLPGSLVYFLTQLAVFPNYLSILVWPSRLSIDHDFAWRTSIMGEGVLLGALLLILTLSLAFFFIRRRFFSFFSFGLLFFILTLAPTSSFLPIRDPMVERRLYLPMAGIAGMLGVGVAGLCAALDERFKKQRYALYVLLCAFGTCVVLANLTIMRNTDYSSRLSLWEATLKTSPHKARVYNNLGLAYMDSGDFFTAEDLFKMAIRLDPGNAKAYNNMGVLFALQGGYKKAETLLVKAAGLAVDYPDPLKNEALLFAYTGRCDTARKVLKEYEAKKIPPGPDKDGRKRIAACIKGKVLMPRDLKF